eukprot:scaffold31_cov334-Pavlova_lutheri.AAC.41
MARALSPMDPSPDAPTRGWTPISRQTSSCAPFQVRQSTSKMDRHRRSGASQGSFFSSGGHRRGWERQGQPWQERCMGEDPRKIDVQRRGGKDKDSHGKKDVWERIQGR